MVQAKSADDHGRGVQSEGGKQQEIIDPVILAEAFAPEQHRITGAQTIKDYGQQENVSVSVSVSEPSHTDRVIPQVFGARRNLGSSKAIAPGAVCPYRR